MKLMVLGAPGAGKGTQAEIISEKYSLPIIGTGNLLRAAIKNETPVGLKIKSFVESGALVPDDVIIELLSEHLKTLDTSKGYILDGVPRTVYQAEKLEELGIKIDKVINLEISDEEIVKRISGRRICGECGSSYHIENNKSKVDGICDKCGGVLAMRADDEPEKVKVRLEAYHKETEPLEHFYANKGKLFSIDGTMGVEDTSNAVFAIIEDL